MLSSLLSWFRPRRGAVVNRGAGRKRASCKLFLEMLEDRCVPSTVQGHVFNDANGNGVFDAGESGLAGWKVFLDGPQSLPLAPSNVLNPGEPFLVTDANGAYSFTDLQSTYYSISRVLQLDQPGVPGRWVDTTVSTRRNPLPASTTITGVDFGVRYQPFVGVAPAGPETLVNQTTAGQQGAGTFGGYETGVDSVSADAAGDYVVAWRTVVPGGMDTIFARVFNADGTARTGDVAVATFADSANSGAMPKVAMAGNAADGGRFMVSWQTRDDAIGVNSIYAQTFRADTGAPVGSLITVLAGNASTTGGLYGIAADTFGDFVITYRIETAKGGRGFGPPTLMAQRYTSGGVVNGSAITFATPGLENGLQSVAMAGAGNFVVVWDDIVGNRGGASSTAVFAQQYTSAGKASGSKITVATGGTTAATGETLFSSVAMNVNGRFVVTYDHSTLGGRAQIYNANGTLAVGPVNFGDVAFGLPASVAMDADGLGNATFVWTTAPGGYGHPWDGEVHMRRLPAGATTPDPVTIANRTTQGPQFSPGVAATGSNRFVVAWQGYGPSDDAGIYAQQFAPVASYVAPSAPQIGSFAADANPTAGVPVTLTVSNITDANPNSTITQVAFYEDTNNDGVPDVLLGYGAQTSPGVWTLNFTFSTSGAHKLFAQALDSYGVLSDPLALDLDVV